MRDFNYVAARSADEAVLLQNGAPGTRFLGGGTTLYDLMKLGIEAPLSVVDVARMRGLQTVDDSDRSELRINAFATMTEVARDPTLKREYPALLESLLLAASQQLRNMATVGGNLLQRTRCPYFRGGAEYACNKRRPGSGCAALEGENRSHALFGGSDSCIAVYPGDWAVALLAFDAQLDIVGPRGARVLALSKLHRQPGEQPQIETVLEPGELIVRIRVPRSPVGRASAYHKVRDRESYAFALTSAAVAMQLEGNRVLDARIALGGVATVPWRASRAEQVLVGESFTASAARRAAEAAFADARPREHNAFKVQLGIETVTAALMLAKDRS